MTQEIVECVVNFLSSQM